MRRTIAALVVFAVALAGDGDGERGKGLYSLVVEATPANVININQTHVFHQPIAMTEVVGALGVQSLGGITLDGTTTGRVGGFLEHRDLRFRMSVSGGVGSFGSEVCYTGVLDYLGYYLEKGRTYRIRYGIGGGGRVCYPLSGDPAHGMPVVELVGDLEFQVIPNVIADVSVMAGVPEGVMGAVGFALAY